MNKKRYAGLYWTRPDKWDKLDTKGIETVSLASLPPHPRCSTRYAQEVLTLGRHTGAARQLCAGEDCGGHLPQEHPCKA